MNRKRENRANISAKSVNSRKSGGTSDVEAVIKGDGPTQLSNRLESLGEIAKSLAFALNSLQHPVTDLRRNRDAVF